jgi:UDP-N-acetylglucosamine:LPS N-acetylglucosamine transferase
MIVYDHLPAKALAPLIREAEIVLARSGYSTVMDLATLGKRAVLIPTPGQTEQEYLGAYLAGKQWAVCVKQAEFSLPEAVRMARSFPYTWLEGDNGRDLLCQEIRSLLQELDGNAKAG